MLNLPGHSLGKYQIMAEIGRGGMGGRLLYADPQVVA